MTKPQRYIDADNQRAAAQREIVTRTKLLIRERTGISVTRNGFDCPNCPWLLTCEALPTTVPVLCELSDAEANIEITVQPQDTWLNQLHMPLRIGSYELEGSEKDFIKKWVA